MCFRKSVRCGSISLEVVLVMATVVTVGMAAFSIAQALYQTLYSFISLWVGSPYF